VVVEMICPIMETAAPKTMWKQRSCVRPLCHELQMEKMHAMKYGGAVSSSVWTFGYPSVWTMDGKKSGWHISPGKTR
jgi:hypothetical protein